MKRYCLNTIALRHIRRLRSNKLALPSIMIESTRYRGTVTLVEVTSLFIAQPLVN